MTDATQEIPSLPADWPQCLPEHPRILLTPERLAHMRSLLTHPEVREVMTLFTAEAERALSQPCIERIVTGRRLLAQSREIERRLVLWAFLAITLDDERYCAAAVREMLHAVSFCDWNPSHFLDVAELAAGVALAYDWLYPRMAADDRRVIREGLLKQSLQPGLQTDAVEKHNNWNSVCNAGLTLAALAIAEDEPEISRQTILRALRYAGRVEGEYSPDGVYLEGPTYWKFGTTYHVLLCDALQTALRTASGLDTMPGLLESVQFIEHVTGAGNAFFNFADSRSRRNPVPCFIWLAQRAQLPALAGMEWQRLLADTRERQARVSADDYLPTDRLHPLFLVWGEPPAAPVVGDLPLTWHGRGCNPVAVARTGWEADAAFLAIKGGRAGEAHGHMDAGTFVYEWGACAGRQTWAPMIIICWNPMEWICGILPRIPSAGVCYASARKATIFCALMVRASR